MGSKYKHKVCRSSKPFVMLLHATRDNEAWRNLSYSAQSLFIELRAEWKGDRSTNGSLSLSYAQAAQKIGATKNTVQAAFHDLQRKGFIVVHKVAALGIEGSGKSFEYEITDAAMPGETKPKNLFKEWRKGHDFEIKMANCGNPKGKRIKQKTHLKIFDDPISKIGAK